jgi:(p)ppGpp synthase/HD superfamily hydrolase
VIKASDAEGVEYVIKGRPKSIYSIRRKMLNQNVSFDEVYDKLRFASFTKRIENFWLGNILL